MQNIIIDTNVLVSALIQKNYPYHIMHDLFIEHKSTRYSPRITLDLISDRDDNKILELADECSADFVITGNTTDFIFPRYKQTMIVTPKEYWENYKPPD